MAMVYVTVTVFSRLFLFTNKAADAIRCYTCSAEPAYPGVCSGDNGEFNISDPTVSITNCDGSCSLITTVAQAPTS